MNIFQFACRSGVIHEMFSGKELSVLCATFTLDGFGYVQMTFALAKVTGK